MMDGELKLRIVLEQPPPGVDFALQKGSGHSYEIVQKQRSGSGDLAFDFSVKVKSGRDQGPDFGGPYVQGPPGQRFVYIDIGTAAGQAGSPWSRRLKVPLRGISWETIESGAFLEARVPGTARDGSPTCATVKPFAGWNGRR